MSADLAASNTRPVDDTLSVAGQITTQQVQAIADAGFKTIICNRPDGESPDQTPYGEIEKQAQSLGLAFYYIPVLSSGMTYENVDETVSALADAPTPIFAYCRSGARSTQVYSLARQKG